MREPNGSKDSGVGEGMGQCQLGGDKRITGAAMRCRPRSALGLRAFRGRDTGSVVKRHATSERAIFEVVPRLVGRVPFAALADLPTPVVALEGLARELGYAGGAYRKCDDLTSCHYGGNKVRTLEVLLANAVAEGASHIYATGAFGSNHAAAVSVHAARLGLASGAVLYPQPYSQAAAANLRIVLAGSARGCVRELPHWSALPWGMWSEERRARARGERPYFMVPGGATELGAMGYVSAGLELALQVARGELPPPKSIIVATGSNCTTAGLLVGVVLAARLGIGFVEAGAPSPPRIVGVRVTPWPVTSVWRIVSLAHRASCLLASLASDARLLVSRRELRQCLELDRSEIGGGYAVETRTGRAAVKAFREHAGIELETTYSGKSAAAFIARMRRRDPGPLLYWSTRTAPLADLARTPDPAVSAASVKHVDSAVSVERVERVDSADMPDRSEHDAGPGLMDSAGTTHETPPRMARWLDRMVGQ
ncbi:MAG: pyridoxal-phosphate dependent enzyme [Myxococcales bacterium]|nr:pyridoxal-phosphate dependent enzyme [Myxococcales bacterium]